MTKSEVMALLEANKNDRGIQHWKRIRGESDTVGYGIGLTQLRKMAKKIGRNHDLALELWQTNCYETKILSTLIEEPKKISREQAEKQVDSINYWMLAHTYCSCDGSLAKVPYVIDLIDEWSKSEIDNRRRSAYLLLGELSKKSKNLSDEYILGYLDIIEEKLQSEENFVKDAMNSALFYIGKRNAVLHARCLEIAQKIGKVTVDYGENSCEAVDVVKHLTNPRLLEKFAV